jgi:hypothetical protein
MLFLILREDGLGQERAAEVFDDDARIVQTLSGLLSWSHFIEIIYQMDPLQRQFYAEMARWSAEAFERCARRSRACFTSALPSPAIRASGISETSTK